MRGSLALALVALALVARGSSAQTISYTAHTLDSTDMRIGRGEPATVVAVFATWCTTCRNEFRTLDSLQQALAPRGIRVLALSVDEKDDGHVRKYIMARRTHVAIARDASGAVSRTFGTVGVPETYLVDDKGIIRWRGRGDLRVSVPSLRRALAELK